MRYDRIRKEVRTDELRQYLRHAAIARALVGALLVVGIAFMALSSLPSETERLAATSSQAKAR